MSSISFTPDPARDPEPIRERERARDAMKPVTNLVEVKDALDRVADRSREITAVFKLFVTIRVVRREMLSMPGRETTVFLVSAIDAIRELCVYGKHAHPELSLNNHNLVMYLSLFTVYTMLGVSAVKTALIEESWGTMYADAFAIITGAPTLDAFEVCDDENVNEHVSARAIVDL